MGRQRTWFHLKRLMLAPRRRLSWPTRYLLPSPHLSSLLSKSTKPSSSLLRFLSTNTAISDAYENGFIGEHPEQGHRSGGESQEGDEVVRYIPVKAYFLSTSIDLKSMQAENACDVIPPTSRSSNYVALRYCEFPPEITDIGVRENKDCDRYVVVFQYGSAVLFNIADHEAEEYLDVIRKHASGLRPEMRKDDYAVVEKPQLDSWMQGGLDYIVLKSLDIDGIRLIGSVLGQSIALDHYIKQLIHCLGKDRKCIVEGMKSRGDTKLVDDMVEEFTDINRGMEKTGTFTMQRKKLFQLVGKANSSLADVIIKLGLFDRSEIAWKNANYAQILEYLREEYELTQRFGNLDFKLKFVEHNVHFLQEVLQNRRSDLLEWGVIILLTIENILCMYEIIKDSNMIPS